MRLNSCPTLLGSLSSFAWGPMGASPLSAFQFPGLQPQSLSDAPRSQEDVFKAQMTTTLGDSDTRVFKNELEGLLGRAEASTRVAVEQSEPPVYNMAALLPLGQSAATFPDSAAAIAGCDRQQLGLPDQPMPPIPLPDRETATSASSSLWQPLPPAQAHPPQEEPKRSAALSWLAEDSEDELAHALAPVVRPQRAAAELCDRDGPPGDPQPKPAKAKSKAKGKAKATTKRPDRTGRTSPQPEPGRQNRGAGADGRPTQTSSPEKRPGSARSSTDGTPRGDEAAAAGLEELRKTKASADKIVQSLADDASVCQPTWNLADLAAALPDRYFRGAAGSSAWPGSAYPSDGRLTCCNWLGCQVSEAPKMLREVAEINKSLAKKRGGYAKKATRFELLEEIDGLLETVRPLEAMLAQFVASKKKARGPPFRPS